MDDAVEVDPNWPDDDSDDFFDEEKVRAEWGTLELLALAGSCICLLLIVGFAIATALAEWPSKATARSVAIVAIQTTTAWLLFAPPLLIIAVGLTWWEADRWSDVLYEAWGATDENDLDPDTLTGEEHQESTDSQLSNGEASETGIDRAAAHLQRLRSLATLQSVLFVITAAAGVARVVEVFLPFRKGYGFGFASSLAVSLTLCFIAFGLAVVGLTIAHRARLLCSWWDYVQEPPASTL